MSRVQLTCDSYFYNDQEIIADIDNCRESNDWQLLQATNYRTWEGNSLKLDHTLKEVGEKEILNMHFDIHILTTAQDDNYS